MAEEGLVAEGMPQAYHGATGDAQRRLGAPATLAKVKRGRISPGPFSMSERLVRIHWF